MRGLCCQTVVKSIIDNSGKVYFQEMARRDAEKNVAWMRMAVKKVKKPGKGEIEAPAFLFSANCGFQMTWEVDYMIALCEEVMQ